ncbi:hypothetical protein D3C87_2161860 [compost metagenome]
MRFPDTIRGRNVEPKAALDTNALVEVMKIGKDDLDFLTNTVVIASQAVPIDTVAVA